MDWNPATGKCWMDISTLTKVCRDCETLISRVTLTVTLLDLFVPVFKQKHGPAPWRDLPPEEGYNFSPLHAML